jgi:FKBP-type peptidyl-prolyl cis-trans isomerase
MATSKSQRIGIWIIAVVMVVGTIGSFFIVVVANQNAKDDQQRAQENYEQQLEQYKKLQEEAQKANRPLEGYKATAFDADTVTKLQTEVLEEGKGKVLKSDSTILANYFGWTADGEIFDSTKKKDKKAEPIEFSLQEVIEGWTKGLTGVKVGSTVRLTIPADQGYGSEDDGSGRPFGPLKFIIQVKELK